MFKGKGYCFKGSNSFKIVFLPSGKGSSIKGKNLLPVGANSFLLEKTPFQKLMCQNQRGSHNSYFPLKITAGNQPSVSIPLNLH